MPHNFWMINCNRQNFEITRDLGFSQQGLKAEYRRKVQRVEPGDRIIFYVSGDRVFAATATVTQGYQEVQNAPWVKEGKTAWPYRIHIKPDVVLNQEQFIDAGLIAYRLEYLRKWPPEDWHMAFQGNLHLLSKGDFFLLETEMWKLKYGREAALLRVDEALADEAERTNAQRDRRRRNAERDPERASRGRNGRTPEKAGRGPNAPATSGSSATSGPPATSGDLAGFTSPASTNSEQPAPSKGRSNSRGRRNQGRNRDRKVVPNAPKDPPKFDNC